MKKICLVLVAVLMLSGCGKPESFETLSDAYVQPEEVSAQQTSLILSEEAILLQQAAGEDRIYLCDDFCVMVQTFAAGDLDATIQSITGYSREKLTVMERQSQGINSYECVWASVGEAGDQVGRLRILDDGNYHYTVSVMADADKAGDLTDTWQLLLDSFAIGQPESTKG